MDTRLDAAMILHYASDEAVRQIASHRLQLVGSDGIFGARPHPRLYATAARFLGSSFRRPIIARRFRSRRQFRRFRAAEQPAKKRHGSYMA